MSDGTSDGTSDGMSDEIPRGKLLFARIILGVMAAFVLAGIVWHGVAPAEFARMWQNLVDRPGGPMLFRFFLQPTMATIGAVLDGLQDARLGRSPFWVTVLHDPSRRARRLNEAVVATSRIMLLGLVMDTIYQVIEFDTFHPAEAVAITLVLALLPYLVLRGLVSRVARRWVGPDATKAGR
jgi:hypothetical protein